MKKYIAFALMAILAFTTVGCGNKTTIEEDEKTTTGEMAESSIIQKEMPKEGDEIVVLTTSMGEIKVQLYPQEAPKAVENFKALVSDGYYDGIIFHRVIDNFMIQGGDPTGTGMGGESSFGEAFEDEISPNLHFYRGALAMANSGPNTNGSQFFIVQNKEVAKQAIDAIKKAKESEQEVAIPIGDKEYNISELYPQTVLDYYGEVGGSIELEPAFGGVYTIFGQVFEGIDIVDSIAKVEKNENDKPITDVVIEKAEIIKYQA